VSKAIRAHFLVEAALTCQTDAHDFLISWLVLHSLLQKQLYAGPSGIIAYRRSSGYSQDCPAISLCLIAIRRTVRYYFYVRLLAGPSGV